MCYPYNIRKHIDSASVQSWMASISEGSDADFMAAIFLWLTGGRITGSEVMDELIQELDGSVATAAQFEGEMEMLAGYAR